MISAPGRAVLPVSVDARRGEHAAELLRSALAGSMVALAQLFFEAYEKRTGMTGDMRKPIDGNYSPQDVRDLAVKALRRYSVSKGGIPEQFASYASRLGTVVVPSVKLVEAVKTIPGIPFIPPTPADEERPAKAAAALQPILTAGPEVLVPVYRPSSAADDAAASGDAVADGQAVVGESGSAAASSGAVLWGLAALGLGYFLFRGKGR